MSRLITFILLFTLSISSIFAQKQTREEYINKYKDIAIGQMNKYGIPASIIIAQACLESADGNSRLATMANNHFGIKCHNWTGETFTHSDDKKDECFRKYASAEESFKDHSDFLIRGKRYQSLFNLGRTDYKAWAYGLKAAGYATNPYYAQMLIDIIEKNSLASLDNQSTDDYVKETKQDNQELKPSITEKPKTRKELRRERRAERKRLKEEKRRLKEEAKKAAHSLVSPIIVSIATPGNIVDNSQDSASNKSYQYSLERKINKINGVSYVIAIGGESYASIAKDYNLFTNEILSFNDVSTDITLQEGTIVYISKKKKSNPIARYKVETEESIYSISQKTGVRLKNLYNLNNISEDSSLIKIGTIIKLE